MSHEATTKNLRLALPKGRMQEGVFRLLADAGIRVSVGARDYRPVLSIPGYEAKILKPQNVIEMLHHGSRDIGFAGADWVTELRAELVELLDTEMDPVRLVAAAPRDLLEDGRLPSRRLLIATEYVGLTESWVAKRGIDAEIVRSYGATEVFPPEDADMIVDNTATGATLSANKMDIVDDLMRSSTRLYATPAVMRDAARARRIEDLVTLLRSVLEARRRVMLEVNCSPANLGPVTRALPAMKQATVSPLHGDAGYAVKAAVPRKALPQVMLDVKAAGGTDIVITAFEQIIP